MRLYRGYHVSSLYVIIIALSNLWIQPIEIQSAGTDGKKLSVNSPDNGGLKVLYRSLGGMFSL